MRGIGQVRRFRWVGIWILVGRWTVVSVGKECGWGLSSAWLRQVGRKVAWWRGEQHGDTKFEIVQGGRTELTKAWDRGKGGRREETTPQHTQQAP